ncbi:hypothetical protein GCM10008995_14310 [Halobellus salinus]|uniref:histidine kinase n=1 Tax=Halobellus salinus TaxID=931585 RepID=A0A830ESH7_9EURY|nr:HAMP domain-containing sensor histidine kinase [Halobellus salinus]GGJ05641.1 hypothetical protein GCM10008995_14310 [Halobellus salinus]SMP23654.1 Signal transduction histidine kinase [Halobellus salinus]
MSASGSWKEYAGLGGIFGTGLGLFGLHTVHALSADESLRALFLGLLIPAGFAVGILAGGAQLRRLDVDGAQFPRVAAWCVGGAVVLSLGAELTILSQQARGVTVSDQMVVVVTAASAGGLVGLIVGVYDTRQRAARAEANQLSQHLTVLNRVLRHDIRTSANVIQGHAELLADGDTASIKHARTIERQAATLVELGDHAREIERLFYKSDAEREDVDLAALVETCCKQIRAEYSDADIDVSLPPTLPAVAHPLVKSAVMNVVENAVEHNDAEAPHVTIGSTTPPQDGDEFVTLRVADNGPGIPDSELAAFDRGYETNLEHASGLGLWLVNWIVVKSGGSVRFEESASGGTVVCLRLRRARAASTISTPSPSLAAEQAA